MDFHPHADRIIKTIRPEFIKDDLQDRQRVAAEILCSKLDGFVNRFELVKTHPHSPFESRIRFDVIVDASLDPDALAAAQERIQHECGSSCRIEILPIASDDRFDAYRSFRYTVKGVES
jgi:hypothetical protein